MAPQMPDETEYRFLTVPDAQLRISLESRPDQRPQLRIYGNRAGLLSLANLLLWLDANSFRREFLAISGLPFVQTDDLLSLSVRRGADSGDAKAGRVVALDGSMELEWELSDEGLRHVALALHGLIAIPMREHDHLDVDEAGAAVIELRMSDARWWLGTDV